MIAKLWAEQVEVGAKSFDEVPAKLRDKVRKILIDDGFTELITTED